MNKDGGYLLFSDPNANTIYKYTPNGNQDGKLDVFRTPSGYSGADIAEYGQPGSNGLTLDPQGRLTINQHGNHRVVRDENDGTQTVLADSYRGQTTQQSERSGLSIGRHALLYRSAVWFSEALQRSAQAACVQWRLFDLQRQVATRQQGLHRTKRNRVLAG